MQLLGNSVNFHTREKERSDLASAIFPSENRPAGRPASRRFSNGRSLRHSGTPKKWGALQVLPEGRGKAPHCKVPAAGEWSQKSAEFGSGGWFNFAHRPGILRISYVQLSLLVYFEDHLSLVATGCVF